MWGGSPRSDVGPGGPTRARAPAPPSDCHCIVRDSIIALWMHSASLNNHGQRAIRARSKSPASTVRSGWSTIPTGAFIWRMVMSGPSQAKSPARTARRTTSSSVSREPRHWAVPEGAGRDLPDRVRLVRRASRRSDRLAGHPAGGQLPAGHARGAGLGRILVRAHGVLGQFQRPGIARRMDRGRGAGYRPHSRFLPAGVPGRAVDPVSFDLDRRPGFLVFPVGHPADGGGLPGDFRERVARAHVAVSMAAVPADVHVRPGEAVERRSYLARPDGAQLSLSNAD